MIVSWDVLDDGSPSLAAHVQEYDASPPVSSLMIDALPSHRHPDREALACYLAFGRWTSGDLVLPEGPSPLVAEAIERDSLPTRVRPREVIYTPRSLPQGRHRVSVVDAVPSAPCADRLLAVVPSPTAKGVFASGRQLIIPSNAFALGDGTTSRRRALLAVAVLFAADIDADVLCLSGGRLPQEEAARLGDLLQCVNLQLDVI